MKKKGTDKKTENIEDLKSKWRGQKSELQDNSPADKKGQKQSSYYKIDHSNKHVPKLGIILRSGKKYYIPYSYQPFIEYTPEIGLSLITSQFRIDITGRGLNEIMEHLYSDRVQWIKESNQRVDDNSESVYITSITIQGKIFEG